MSTNQQFTREIRYDRRSKDYALYLDGELLGFSMTYHDGETTLDALMSELLQHNTPIDEAEALAAELAHEYSLPIEEARALAARKLKAVLAYAQKWDEVSEQQRRAISTKQAA